MTGGGLLLRGLWSRAAKSVQRALRDFIDAETVVTGCS